MNKKNLPWLMLLLLLLPVLTSAQTIQERLKGYILLQVEENGEAWYVDPLTNKREYIQNGQTAYELMRQKGLGITNKNLNKIPVGIQDKFTDTDTDGDGLSDRLEEGLKTSLTNSDTDGDGYNDKIEVENNHDPLSSNALELDYELTASLSGRIVLQIEEVGQAWYVNPSDQKRYYMKDGQAAYDIMRYLSLGITNLDLEKIEIAPTQDVEIPNTNTNLNSNTNTNTGSSSCKSGYHCNINGDSKCYDSTQGQNLDSDIINKLESSQVGDSWECKIKDPEGNTLLEDRYEITGVGLDFVKSKIDRVDSNTDQVTISLPCHYEKPIQDSACISQETN